MDSVLSKEILRKVRRVEIRTKRLVDETFSGRYHSVFKGQGMSFDEVREYVPGDEIRSIDWNVTARAGHPFVKKFSEERELTIILAIDVSASGDFGSASRSKRELAAELGSILAFSASTNNDKVGLVLFTEGVELFIPPRKGRSHLLRIVREILFFKPQKLGTRIPEALDFINRILPRRAIVFLISDFCLPGIFQNSLDTLRSKLRLTNKHHDLVAISVSDPREQSIPDVGLLTLEDAETGEQIELNTRNSNIRRQFEVVSQDRNNALKSAFRAAAVDSLQIKSGEDYMPELLSFFKTREKRRL